LCVAFKRLYVLDCPELRGLDLHLNGVTLYAPTMLIYRTGAEKLDVLGIQLEPTREDAPVYTPDSKVPKKYLFPTFMSPVQTTKFISSTTILAFAI
jgi:hypothetical protein